MIIFQYVRSITIKGAALDTPLKTLIQAHGYKQLADVYKHMIEIDNNAMIQGLKRFTLWQWVQADCHKESGMKIQELISTHLDEDIFTACQTLAEHKIHRLAVFDAKK